MHKFIASWLNRTYRCWLVGTLVNFILEWKLLAPSVVIIVVFASLKPTSSSLKSSTTTKSATTITPVEIGPWTSSVVHRFLYHFEIT